MKNRSLQKWWGVQDLSDEEMRILREAQRQGYLVTKGYRPKLATAWATYCDSTNYPLVKVTCLGNHAKVLLDLQQTDVSLTHSALHLISNLLYLAGAKWIECNANIVYGSEISKEQAEPLARILIELVVNLHHTTERHGAKIA